MRKAAGIFLLSIGLAAGARAELAPVDLVYQLAPTTALSAGVLEGGTRFSRMLALGDFGLGALSPVDGEIIVLGGKAYQADLEGRIRAVSDQEQTPFLTVKRFTRDQRFTLSQVRGMAHLARALDARLPSANGVYAVRLDGRFQALKLRSVPRQKPPYRPIDQVVAEQNVYELADVTGTLVGFRLPDYLAAVSGAGYHFHFIDRERRRGGHLLDLRGEDLTVSVDRGGGVALLLPEDEAFADADLRLDSQSTARFQRAVRGEAGQ
ncbi:acetolactate decarboxylase [Alloalcanivorax xenomutans]|uniref:acetolactate decarboxylase n=1 Tax=Alloalcanivorax xenomutans TaxID=1094342 RepID=UPI003A7F720D